MYVIYFLGGELSPLKVTADTAIFQNVFSKNKDFLLYNCRTFNILKKVNHSLMSSNIRSISKFQLSPQCLL